MLPHRDSAVGRACVAAVARQALRRALAAPPLSSLAAAQYVF
jgi:hypothetical protein